MIYQRVVGEERGRKWKVEYIVVAEPFLLSPALRLDGNKYASDSLAFKIFNLKSARRRRANEKLLSHFGFNFISASHRHDERLEREEKVKIEEET